jgi:hypothetical protein
MALIIEMNSDKIIFLIRDLADYGPGDDIAGPNGFAAPMGSTTCSSW